MALSNVMQSPTSTESALTPPPYPESFSKLIMGSSFQIPIKLQFLDSWRLQAQLNVPRLEGIHKFRSGETEAEFHEEFSPLGFQQQIPQKSDTLSSLGPSKRQIGN